MLFFVVSFLKLVFEIETLESSHVLRKMSCQVAAVLFESGDDVRAKVVACLIKATPGTSRFDHTSHEHKRS